MNKSIYSLVLSDEVVEAVDKLAHENSLSRSAMINRILAERVSFTTPEMRLRQILQAAQKTIADDFGPALLSGNTLSARTFLKYRYKPTARYSLEISSQKGVRRGRLKVFFRSQNEELISALTEFFGVWAELEKKYISRYLREPVEMVIGEGVFVRTLNIPDDAKISDEKLGEAAAEYMAMFDGTMKEYFAALPDPYTAKCAADMFYSNAIKRQKIVL